MVKQNTMFPIKCISEFIVYVSNFLKYISFYFFKKKLLFGELFQKRFTGGICHLRGACTRNPATPYTWHSLVSRCYQSSFSGEINNCIPRVCRNSREKHPPGPPARWVKKRQKNAITFLISLTFQNFTDLVKSGWPWLQPEKVDMSTQDH